MPASASGADTCRRCGESVVSYICSGRTIIAASAAVIARRDLEHTPRPVDRHSFLVACSPLLGDEVGRCEERDLA